MDWVLFPLCLGEDEWQNRVLLCAGVCADEMSQS